MVCSRTDEFAYRISFYIIRPKRRFVYTVFLLIFFVPFCIISVFSSYSSCTVSTMRFTASIESLRSFFFRSRIRFFVVVRFCAMHAYTVPPIFIILFFISLRSLSFCISAVFTHCTNTYSFVYASGDSEEKKQKTKKNLRKKRREIKQKCCHRDRCFFSIAIAA